MRKLLSWVAAVTLVAGVIGIGGNGSKAQAAEAQSFKDVSVNAWYYSYVNDALSRGVISGFPNGTFKPDDPVTVAQFLKIVLLSYADESYGYKYWAESQLEYVPDWNKRNLHAAVGTFDEGSPWYEVYVDVATDLFLIPEGEYVGRYNEPITREKAASIIDELDSYFHGFSQKEYSMLTGTQLFKDFNRTEDYYEQAVGSIAVRGIMVGNDKGYFNPKSYISRAEAAKISSLLNDPKKRTPKTPNMAGLPYATVPGQLGYPDRIHIFANHEMMKNYKVMKDRQNDYDGFVSGTFATLRYFKDEEAKFNNDKKAYYLLVNDPNIYHDVTISFDSNAYSINLNVEKEALNRAKTELKYFVELVFGANGAKVFTELESAIVNAQARKDVDVDKVIAGRQLVISNANPKVLNIGISAYSDSK
ncbi:hypothetical protein D3P08_10815 [Paenibacillus nanensis]|uniref:SLH domain-containing protein n=1 Tax=Paenibacillus nanensis TaxID=393251 RepID=A0A3A1V6I0_9BACL|nr:S-layer homology domain-containing protein [Paenibacillus nanensis]RIX53120.1 hypothetical protein D3P08_10815 [Paenibacillus nanensis]